MTYDEAKKLIERTRNPEKGYLLKRNTRLIMNDDNSISIRLYKTNILTFSKSKIFTLNSGGYRTSTTKNRLNEYLPPPWRIKQVNWKWFLLGRLDGKYVFYDGMLVPE